MTSDVRAVRPLTAPLDAVAWVPGSKSITNRALVCAALAPGLSRLHGLGLSDDTEAMLECVARLGVHVELDGTSALVRGNGGRLPDAPVVMSARQSGTTGRFLLAVAALGSAPVTIDAAPQLRARPMADGMTAVRALGASVDETSELGHLPATVTGVTPWADRVGVAGDVSSQFLSGLMLAAPAAGGLTIDITGELVSRPYVDMTAAVIGAFGPMVTVDERSVTVGGGYRPCTYEVEPDASGASYFLAAAAIAGGTVRINGLGRRSLQGDVRFAEVLARMGAQVDWTDHSVTVTGTGRLHGGVFDLADISDTAPTLAAIAPFAESPVEVTGIGFIRHKETDRVAAPVAELRRLGIRADETADGFVIHPGRPVPVEPVHTYDDHRMAMAFAVIGLVVPGLEIADPGCVAKTFPTFFDELDALG